MKRLVSAVLVALPLLSAVPAWANFSGEYTLVFLSGPQHYKSASYCMVFINTGSIYGFPNSDTWQERDSADWGGNFVVDGNTLRWYGTIAGGTEVMNFYNNLNGSDPGKGGFDDWFLSYDLLRADGRGDFARPRLEDANLPTECCREEASQH